MNSKKKKKEKTMSKLTNKDLMIGDFVRLKHTKKIVCVFEIDDDRDVINNESDGYCSEKNIYIDDVEPIPITYEILEKNFAKDDCWLNAFYINDHIHIYDTAEGFWNIQYLELIEIRYVHELQHCLRLCGFEKEIEL